jgi:hypothetical protein
MNPIVITGMPRGGSSYLHNLVATYYGIRNFHEWPRNYLTEPWGPVTNPNNIKHDPVHVQQERCLEMIYRIHKEIYEYPVYIVKDHAQHYYAYEKIMGESFPFDRIYENFHRILITRRENLEMTFSLAISLKTNTWNDFFTKKNRKLTIDTDLFLRARDMIIDHDSAMNNWIDRGIRYDDTVRYEDMSSNAEQDRFKLQTTSGFREQPLEVAIVKRKPFKEVVTNWQELEKLYHEQ